MKKILGLLAVAGLLVVAAPAQRAHALALSNPGAAATAKYASENLGMTTEVRWHRWHHHRWGHRHHWRRHWGWRHHRWHRRYYRYY